MNKTQAREIAHTLGNPSKMPGKSYGLPAAECAVGSKLRNVPGSTCADCYAMKGRYQFSNVTTAHYKRLESIDHPQWVQAMVKLIGKERWFRWHDSGDLQSVGHLSKVCMVAAMTPNTRHWLPTREKGIVTRYLQDGGEIPANLTIRLSAAMVDGEPPATNDLPGVQTSTVHRDAEPKGHTCPAPKQSNECDTCRACWSRDVNNVSYKVH